MKEVVNVRTADNFVHRADDWTSDGDGEWVVLQCRQPIKGSYTRVEEPVTCLKCIMKVSLSTASSTKS